MLTKPHGLGCFLFVHFKAYKKGPGGWMSGWVGEWVVSRWLDGWTGRKWSKWLDG